MLLRGLLTAGALAITGTAVYVGYTNKEKFYDKRLGGFYLKNNVSESLNESISSNIVNPIRGLTYPLESVILVIVEQNNNNIVIPLSKLDGGAPKWTLIKGIVKSWKHMEDSMTNYSDERFSDYYLDENSNCEDVVFENPKRCLAREVIEELTGGKHDPICRHFDWLIERIYNNSNWTFIKMDKTDIADYFHTYTGLCRITLSSKEIARLNSQINPYLERKHLYFASKEWVVKESEVDGKHMNRFSINVENYNIQEFIDDEIFLHHWKELSELIVNDK